MAYARYMKSLYNQFGDWYLAMAAYDWGPGNVQRAVMRTGYADFWELYRRNVLPAETKNYVPGIIAAIIMAKNPKQYGLDRMVPDPPVVSDTVTVNYAIDLRLVADVTERLAAGDCGAESEPAAHDHAARHGLRSPSSCRDEGCLSQAHQEIPEDKRTQLALPCGAGWRVARRHCDRASTIAPSRSRRRTT